MTYLPITYLFTYYGQSHNNGHFLAIVQMTTQGTTTEVPRGLVHSEIQVLNKGRQLVKSLESKSLI